jgi:hypothetical protein
MITRATLSTIEQGLPKYRSMLAGNAAFSPGSYESIATTSVGGSGATTVTFSSIPATYTHLQLRWIGRQAQANTALGVYIRINGNTGSNYSRHWLRGSGVTASSAASNSTDRIDIGGTSGANSPSNIFGVGIIDILDYTNTNKYKTIRSFNGTNQNTTGDHNVFLASGVMFANLNAVTQIDVVADSSGAGFVQYSHFALYGIKVA